MDYQTKEFFGGIAVTVMVVILTWAILLALFQANYERGCLLSGYKHGSIDFLFNGYCVTRVDQTDIVVPYSKRGQR
jgi:hypothetical protein